MVAHDAVDIRRFTPVIEKKKAKLSLGLNPDDIIVCYLGSLYANRSIRDIIDIASKLPEINFRLAGGPEKERSTLTRHARAIGLKNVEFIGRVERRDVPNHLFGSDILLFTMNEGTLTYDICSPMKIF